MKKINSDHVLISLMILALLAIFIPAMLSRDKSLQTHFNFSTWSPVPKIIPTKPVDFLNANLHLEAWQQSKHPLFVLPTNENQHYLAAVPVDEYVARPKAFVIQLGSFTDIQNANALIARLLLHKIPAYVGEFELNKQHFYRVLIGPVLNKNQADNWLNEIKILTNLKPIVRPLIG